MLCHTEVWSPSQYNNKLNLESKGVQQDGSFNRRKVTWPTRTDCLLWIFYHWRSTGKLRIWHLCLKFCMVFMICMFSTLCWRKVKSYRTSVPVSFYRFLPARLTRSWLHFLWSSRFWLEFSLQIYMEHTVCHPNMANKAWLHGARKAVWSQPHILNRNLKMQAG